MKPSDIKVGKTYTNKGVGRTQRTVLAIGDEHRPRIFWNATNTPPDEPGVLYEQKGKKQTLYMSSFAKWCGKEV